jgi:hypothetical protein
MRALALVALAACTDYAQLSLKNAPGNVDLGHPLPHENGDPERFEPPEDPGMSAVAAVIAPYILGGAGRYASSEPTGEAGFEVRVEHAAHGRIEANNWGITTGMAFAQWAQGTRTVLPGAFYAELGYRHVFGNGVPLDVALGPALYVDDSAIGAQMTLRWYVFMFRTRYVANTGFEAFGGAEIPVPFFFERSN